MARDVEFNVTANDKSDAALRSAAKNLERAQRDMDKRAKEMRDNAEKAFGGLGRSAIAAANLISPKIGAAVTQGFATGAQAAGPLMASAAAYAAPLIGGLLSAAIVGGAGVGGVAGGVALAARDPAVKAAGEQLGETLMGSLTSAASPFVPATLEAIGKVEQRFEQMDSKIRRIFANSAEFLEPLTEGGLDLLDGLVSGFDKLVAKAGPTIDAMGAGMTQLGAATDYAMGLLVGDGEAAAHSMSQLFDIMSGGIIAVSGLIRGLSEINVLLDRLHVPPGLLQMISQLSEGTGTLSRHVAGQSDAFVAAGGAAVSYGSNLEQVAEVQSRLIGQNVSLYAATTNAAQAYRDASEAVEKNGRGLDLNTEAGRKNRTALSNLATSLNTAYDKYVEVNGAAGNANDVLIQNRNHFIEVATKATGSAAAARKLADELIGIPDRRPKVELLDNATGKINNVINRLAAVRSKTVNLTVAVRQSGDAAALRKQSQTSAYSAGSATHAGIAAGPGSRIGGPVPVQVSNRVLVSLDGAPFGDYTARAIADNDARNEFRERVGTR